MAVWSLDGLFGAREDLYFGADLVFLAFGVRLVDILLEWLTSSLMIGVPERPVNGCGFDYLNYSLLRVFLLALVA